VMHSVDKIEALIERDQNLQRVVSELMDTLYKP
jgi:chromosomal replication initiation ATPase DnaA